MTKRQIWLTAVLLLALLPPLSAVPARPGRYMMKQPDGSTVTLIRHGDEFLHWTTMADGKTVVARNRDGFYRPSVRPDREALGVVLFSFFRKKQDLFSKSTVIGRSLQYVGRRTLDVYLIHYFLIPKSLSFITVFTDHPMPIIEASVSLVITIIIIAGCLLIGNIIRLSPFLAHWAFGAKKVKN